jgi:hypothetical protein
VGTPGHPLRRHLAGRLSDAGRRRAAGAHAAYINGDCITIDGGRWLKGAGTFSHLDSLSDAEWTAMRERGRGSTQ